MKWLYKWYEKKNQPLTVKNMEYRIYRYLGKVMHIISDILRKRERQANSNFNNIVKVLKSC